MSATGRRVALLARPGVACDRLRVALADAGAHVVLEADPLTLDPATLDAAQAQVVMVALDTQTEDALDRFEAALHDPAIEVIFEEADLAARREGWEAARWARHLAAKLHRHDDVLPPGSGSMPTTGQAAGSDGPHAAQPPGEPVLHVAAEDPGLQRTEMPAEGSSHAFDPLLAEFSFDADAPSPHSEGDVFIGIDVAADGAVSDAPPRFDPNLDFSYDGSFDPDAAGMPAIEASIAGFDPFAFDPHGGASVEELSANHRDASAPEPGFDRMFDGDFAAAASGQAAQAPARRELDPPTATPPSGSLKHLLELVSTDDEMAPALRGYAEPSAEGSVADHRFKHDLASLESRIAGMELVDDRITKGPAQAGGAVLVLAGIGGPDAVRQLLGALPAGFPRPVLVQQRLDGGRYDKLVAQMQRATALPVTLAEPGLPAVASTIYILPAGVGVRVEEAGILFTDAGDDVLAALPSADSAVLLLSGSDPTQLDAVMHHSWAGALVIGQAPDGCYDAAAPSALIARGGGSGQPAELARRLAERWRT